MKHTHLEQLPHRLFLCLVLCLSFLWPLQTSAQAITSSEAQFTAPQQLSGTTQPASTIFIYDQDLAPVKLLKSTRDGHFSLTYPFKDSEDYFIVMKTAKSFHYFTITYDEQALQDELEIGGGFMSGENDSYTE